MNLAIHGLILVIIVAVFPQGLFNGQQKVR